MGCLGEVIVRGHRNRPCSFLALALGAAAISALFHTGAAQQQRPVSCHHTRAPNGTVGPFTQAQCADSAHHGGFHWMLLHPLPSTACAGAVCTVAECCVRHESEDVEHHTSLAIAATGLCVAFVAAVLITDLLEKHGLTEMCPSSTVMILMGCALGFLGLLDEHVRGFMDFDPEVFGFFLLPVIIFSSAYNLGEGAMHVFFVQIGRISFFAVFGTLFAIGFFGLLLFAADSAIGFIPEKHGGAMKTNEIFMFASLISAVDPVATLGAFAALGVEPKLNALIYGESILNDAVAIGAYRVFEEMESDGFSPHKALLNVAWLLAGSLGCGIGSGVLSALLFKHFGRMSKCFGAKRNEKHEGADDSHDDHGGHENLEHAMVEAAMFFFASMASFYIAEIFHLSGIISALFAGMICNHYAWFNLTKAGQSLSRHFYEQMMVIMEQLVCIWVGIVFVFSLHDGIISWPFTILALVFVVASRGVTVFSLAWVVNACLRWRKRPACALSPPPPRVID
jgi:sodium/hydrogen exchanger 8